MDNYHEFGGDWTRKKLNILKKYLQSYSTALKRQNFNRIYIDAFAGSGYISTKEKPGQNKPQFRLFDLPEDEDYEEQQYIEGSARIALQVEPSFDHYIFIEKKEKHFNDLNKLKEEFPNHSITILNKEANECLLDLCYNEIDWYINRAVLFLDPYGMQVDWKTIKAISETKAIDLWYLFPLGIGVNRLLKKDGNIGYAEKNRLNRIFGAIDWYEAFYNVKTEKGLFDEYQIIEKTGKFNLISDYIIERLKTVFPGVAGNPRLLYNSKGNPLFLFCFAAARPGRASEIAIKIAQHILKSSF